MSSRHSEGSQSARGRDETGIQNSKLKTQNSIWADSRSESVQVGRLPADPEVLPLRQVLESGTELLVGFEGRVVAGVEPEGGVQDLDSDAELDVRHVLLTCLQ